MIEKDDYKNFVLFTEEHVLLKKQIEQIALQNDIENGVNLN